MQESVRRAGIAKPATPHRPRHSFAAHPLLSGYDIRTVQELLSHKDVSITMIYTQVLNRGGRGVRSPLDGAGVYLSFTTLVREATVFDRPSLIPFHREGRQVGGQDHRRAPTMARKPVVDGSSTEATSSEATACRRFVKASGVYIGSEQVLFVQRKIAALSSCGY